MEETEAQELLGGQEHPMGAEDLGGVGGFGQRCGREKGEKDVAEWLLKEGKME